MKTAQNKNKNKNFFLQFYLCLVTFRRKKRLKRHWMSRLVDDGRLLRVVQNCGAFSLLSVCIHAYLRAEVWGQYQMRKCLTTQSRIHNQSSLVGLSVLALFHSITPPVGISLSVRLSFSLTSIPNWYTWWDRLLQCFYSERRAKL